ncbi:hypothetical protein AB1Y20_018359 [Prymnesium parvum]|uniref:DOT1 domain-containing protein n=1 Tax=Prymnesium parvum TaxID=97485 RepID=A0AB34JRZ5_PRYPA
MALLLLLGSSAAVAPQRRALPPSPYPTRLAAAAFAPRPRPIRCELLPSAASEAAAAAGAAVLSLFGDVSSPRAFRRQSIAAREVEAEHAGRARELTYGELRLDFFWELLAAAAPRAAERFVDVGSGCGRLVLAAALAHEWEWAAGVELLRGLHEVAEASHASLREAARAEGVPLAPCRFVCAEAERALPSLLGAEGSTAVVFVYASCWPSVGPYLPRLSQTLAAVLPSGSRVITVDKQLVSSDDATVKTQELWRFELLASMSRPNYNTFESVGYVYELVRGDLSAANSTLLT